MIGGSPLRAVRIVVGTALLGIAIGLAAFQVTSTHPPYRYLGPLCAADGELPGFDPWTGEPHGRRYLCSETAVPDGHSHWVAVPTPAELVGRRAIPLPVGIPVGLLAAAAAVAYVSWRRGAAGPPTLAGHVELRTLLSAVLSGSIGFLLLVTALGPALLLVVGILGLLAMLRPVREAVLHLIGLDDLQPGRFGAWASETAVITLAFLLFGSFGPFLTVASAALGLSLLPGDPPRAGPSWTERWQAMERAADADIDAGRVTIVEGRGG